MQNQNAASELLEQARKRLSNAFAELEDAIDDVVCEAQKIEHINDEIKEELSKYIHGLESVLGSEGA